MGKRILVTGIDSFWGARVAKALENDPGVDLVLGVGIKEPPIELENTETLQADQSYSLLSKIVRATKVDTIIHAFLKLDEKGTSPKELNEANVIATMNLLAAAGSANSKVTQLVFKSSSLVYGCSPQDPAYFTEDHKVTLSPTSYIAKTVIDAESYLRDFADDNPHICVSLIRFANVIGNNIDTAITRNFKKSIAPYILGYDPNIQLIEEEDVVSCIEFAVKHELQGIYNAAGDHPAPWSVICKITGARRIPILAYATSLWLKPLTMTSILEAPNDLIELIKYGRGLDNSRLKEAGFLYKYDTLQATEAFARANRLTKTIGKNEPGYKYQKSVELFFKHSPAIQRD